MAELRVILPGAQALFGFQVSAVLTERFEQISDVSRAVRLGSTGMVVVAIILLLAPVAYHRIAAPGEAEVLRYTVKMMLPVEGLIAAALVGDALVTLRMVSGDPIISLRLSAAAAVTFAICCMGCLSQHGCADSSMACRRWVKQFVINALAAKELCLL